MLLMKTARYGHAVQHNKCSTLVSRHRAGYSHFDRFDGVMPSMAAHEQEAYGLVLIDAVKTITT